MLFRSDSRELVNLQRCKEELMGLAGLSPRAPSELIALPTGRRRGRRPNA